MYTIYVVKCITKSSSGLEPPVSIPSGQIAILRDKGLDRIKSLLEGFLKEERLILSGILLWRRPLMWSLDRETTAYVYKEVEDV